MKPLAQVAKSKIANITQDASRSLAVHAPQIETLAVSWIERLHPLTSVVRVFWRRGATVTVVVIAGLLFVHVMLGANGMIVFRQKRTEYDSLKKQIVHVDQENERYTQQIEGLKTDQKAIEKEAREQLGYVKPGEYKYVSPTPAAPTEPNRNTTKK
jgi:cell division protein FtsB